MGVIEVLRVMECTANFAALESSHLRGTTVLQLYECELSNTGLIRLSEIIPHLTCLKVLQITAALLVVDGKEEGLLKVLQQLYHSSVTELDIVDTILEHHSPDYYKAIQHLIDPQFGKLEALTVGNEVHANNAKLVDLVSANSCLKYLALILKSPVLNVHLMNNTNLHTFELDCSNLCDDLSDLIDVVKNNKTLKRLAFHFRKLHGEYYLNRNGCEGIDAVRPLVSALQENNTLEELALGIMYYKQLHNYMESHQLTLDPRILPWKPSMII